MLRCGMSSLVHTSVSGIGSYEMCLQEASVFPADRQRYFDGSSVTANFLKTLWETQLSPDLLVNPWVQPLIWKSLTYLICL